MGAKLDQRRPTSPQVQPKLRAKHVGSNSPNVGRNEISVEHSPQRSRGSAGGPSRASRRRMSNTPSQQGTRGGGPLRAPATADSLSAPTPPPSSSPPAWRAAAAAPLRWRTEQSQHWMAPSRRRPPRALCRRPAAPFTSHTRGCSADNMHERLPECRHELRCMRLRRIVSVPR